MLPKSVVVPGVLPDDLRIDALLVALVEEWLVLLLSGVLLGIVVVVPDEVIESVLLAALPAALADVRLVLPVSGVPLSVVVFGSTVLPRALMMVSVPAVTLVDMSAGQVVGEPVGEGWIGSCRRSGAGAREGIDRAGDGAKGEGGRECQAAPNSQKPEKPRNALASRVHPAQG